jgi:hypothetical protein
VAGWDSRERPRRTADLLGTWFSPERWSPYDLFTAFISVVLAVSVFVPWFQATVRIHGSDLSGILIEPKPTKIGITVHPYLWAVFALALLDFGILAARYRPGPRAVRLPGYRPVLIVASALIAVVVLVAFVSKPIDWSQGNPLGPEFSLVVTWTYGAVIALGAALVSVGVGLAALREQRTSS